MRGKELFVVVPRRLATAGTEFTSTVRRYASELRAVPGRAQARQQSSAVFLPFPKAVASGKVKTREFDSRKGARGHLRNTVHDVGA